MARATLPDNLDLDAENSVLSGYLGYVRRAVWVSARTQTAGLARGVHGSVCLGTPSRRGSRCLGISVRENPCLDIRAHRRQRCQVHRDAPAPSCEPGTV